MYICRCIIYGRLVPLKLFPTYVRHASVGGEGHLDVALGTHAVCCQMARPRRHIKAASPHAAVHGIHAEQGRRHGAVESAGRHHVAGGRQRAIQVEGAAILISRSATLGALDEGLGTFELAVVVDGAGALRGRQPALLRCPRIGNRVSSSYLALYLTIQTHTLRLVNSRHLPPTLLPPIEAVRTNTNNGPDQSSASLHTTRRVSR
jgi:hypothetical protein